MKTISLIFFLIGISFFGYTQEATTEEIKGKNNTYIKYENKSYHYYFIYNKNYELMHRRENPGLFYIPISKIENKRKMHEAVEKHILPYVKKYIDNMKGSIKIGCVSGLDGVVKEVTFSYPNDWDIPITALEDLENELLSIPLTLGFNRNYPTFKRGIVTTVDRNYAYGKSALIILRDQGAKWIIDDEDLIREPEVGNPKPDPKPDKPIIIIDDGTDSNPINEDNPLDRPLF